MPYRTPYRRTRRSWVTKRKTSSGGTRRSYGRRSYYKKRPTTTYKKRPAKYTKKLVRKPYYRKAPAGFSHAYSKKRVSLGVPRIRLPYSSSYSCVHSLRTEHNTIAWGCNVYKPAADAEHPAFMQFSSQFFLFRPRSDYVNNIHPMVGPNDTTPAGTLPQTTPCFPDGYTQYRARFKRYDIYETKFTYHLDFVVWADSGIVGAAVGSLYSHLAAGRHVVLMMEVYKPFSTSTNYVAPYIAGAFGSPRRLGRIQNVMVKKMTHTPVVKMVAGETVRGFHVRGTASVNVNKASFGKQHANPAVVDAHGGATDFSDSMQWLLPQNWLDTSLVQISFTLSEASNETWDANQHPTGDYIPDGGAGNIDTVVFPNHQNTRFVLEQKCRFTEPILPTPDDMDDRDQDVADTQMINRIDGDIAYAQAAAIARAAAVAADPTSRVPPLIAHFPSQASVAPHAVPPSPGTAAAAAVASMDLDEGFVGI